MNTLSGILREVSYFLVSLLIHVALCVYLLVCDFLSLPSVRGDRIGRAFVIAELYELEGVDIEESHIVRAGLVSG